MRYSKQISTGKIVETQSGGNPENPAYLQTLVDNAVNAGYALNDIEAGYEDDEVVRGWLNYKTPLEIWESDMKASDGIISRVIEDIYDALPVSITDNIAQATKDKIVAKKTKRSEKP
jgi:hypothetical protein